MSRFTELLNSFVFPQEGYSFFDSTKMKAFLLLLANKMESPTVSLRMEVDYFVHQESPVTANVGVAPIKGIIDLTMFAPPDSETGLLLEDAKSEPTFHINTGIVINGMTCCPCSREISDFDHETGKGRGAHAQRSEIKVSVNHSIDDIIWFEDLIDICWDSFSHPVVPLLKRPDERHVTIASYDNPKFVEDVIRDVVVGLRKNLKVGSYRVRVCNAESIHYHDAYAEAHGNAHEDRMAQ